MWLQGWKQGKKVVLIFFFLLSLILALYCYGKYPIFHNQNDVIVKYAAPRITAFITPHHLLAKEEIENIFRTVSKQVGESSITRVILLSPNHFNIGHDWIISSTENWQTPFGNIAGDTNAKPILKSVFFGSGIFEREHGIRNLLPYVKQYFPQASVIPLMVRDGMPHDQSDALGEELSELSDAHTLLIVSADFSHYLDWNFSRFHDATALSVLKRSDVDAADSLDVDCAACLRIIMQYARKENAPNFQFVSRSSSLEMSGSHAVGEETSHITGYFSSLPPEDSQPASCLLFSGQVTPEMMSDNARRVFMGQSGNIFERHGKVVWNTFTTVPLDGWYRAANNPSLFDSASGTALRQIGDQRIVFVDSHNFVDQGAMQAKLRALKKENDTIIVLWYWTKKPASIHEVIDAGADMVIGMNLVDIESLQVYHNRLIVPSLGRVNSQCQTKICQGAILGVNISDTQIQAIFMPIIGSSEGVTLATNQTREKILKSLTEKLSDPRQRVTLLDGMLTLEKN